MYEMDFDFKLWMTKVILVLYCLVA